MKKYLFFMPLSAFVFTCAGAFASINHMTPPVDLYAKINGICQVSCAATGEFVCIVNEPLYHSIQDFEHGQNTVTMGFQPLE